MYLLVFYWSMFEAYDYISSKHFVQLIQEHCSSATCNLTKLGYTFCVEVDSQRQSFAKIKEGAEESYVYYDTQSARKRTQLHPEDGREYGKDHVVNRIADPQQPPHITDYTTRHEDRLLENRAGAPDAPVLGTIGKGDGEHLYDVVFGNETAATESEICQAFRDEMEERSQQLNKVNLDESRHDQYEKMFGRRVEPLQKAFQPDIALELVLIGAYEQVSNAMQSH